MDEKKWNAKAGNWEIDGTSVSYRVSWRNIDSGDEHTEEFTDVDQGHDFYKDMQKSAHAISVKWEHAPW